MMRKIMVLLCGLILLSGLVISEYRDYQQAKASELLRDIKSIEIAPNYYGYFDRIPDDYIVGALENTEKLVKESNDPLLIQKFEDSKKRITSDFHALVIARRFRIYATTKIIENELLKDNSSAEAIEAELRKEITRTKDELERAKAKYRGSIFAELNLIYAEEALKNAEHLLNSDFPAWRRLSRAYGSLESAKQRINYAGVFWKIADKKIHDPQIVYNRIQALKNRPELRDNTNNSIIMDTIGLLNFAERAYNGGYYALAEANVKLAEAYLKAFHKTSNKIDVLQELEEIYKVKVKMKNYHKNITEEQAYALYMGIYGRMYSADKILGINPSVSKNTMSPYWDYKVAETVFEEFFTGPFGGS